MKQFERQQLYIICSWVGSCGPCLWVYNHLYSVLDSSYSTVHSDLNTRMNWSFRPLLWLMKSVDSVQSSISKYTAGSCLEYIRFSLWCDNQEITTIRIKMGLRRRLLYALFSVHTFNSVTSRLILRMPLFIAFWIRLAHVLKIFSNHYSWINLQLSKFAIGRYFSNAVKK